MPANQLAVVTGASTGIGYHLAELCARDGFDLIVVADEPRIHEAAEILAAHGTKVEAVQEGLARESGIAALVEVIGDRPVDALLANAGRGLGHAFLEQRLDEIKHVIDLNVAGTVSLVHKVGQQMCKRNSGRILITGSIAGDIPGSYQAVYNASKAFLNSFSVALADELKETEVTVTCLMPGPTATKFFERAHMRDTPVGQDDSKADPATVARDGFEAMMTGKLEVVSGWKNKAQSAMSGVMPDPVLANMHRNMAKPEHE